MLKPSEQTVTFLRPLWRRIALLVALGGWTAVELVWGDAIWAGATAALFAYSVWAFVIAMPADDTPPPR